MRLQDPSKVIRSFAIALRAIGQDLTPLLPQTFELRFEDEAFLAHGVALRAAPEPEPQSGAPAENEKKSAHFERRYTAEDVYRLDRAGRMKQSGLKKKTPDAASLSESLRTVGKVVDAKAGRLVRILKDERNKITFEYVDSSGAMQREESHTLGVYQEQQKAIAERTGKDVWDDSKD
jgi:hypothetical protein